MKRQGGVALLVAIFLIVVIAAAIALLANLSSRNNQQLSQQLLQLRAQAATHAIIEYAIQEIVVTDGCPSATSPTLAAFAGFTAALSCTTATYGPAGQQFSLYQLTASARYGQPNQPDYAWATRSAAVEQ